MGRRSLKPTNVPDQETGNNELDQEYARYTEMDGGYYSMNSDLTDTRYPTYHHYSDNNPNACFGYLLVILLIWIVWGVINNIEDTTDI